MGVPIETRLYRFLKKKAKKVRAKRAKARAARKRAANRSATARQPKPKPAATAAPTSAAAPRQRTPTPRPVGKPSPATHPVAAWRNMAADINAWRANGLTATREARERSAAMIQQAVDEKAQRHAKIQADIAARKAVRQQKSAARKAAAAERQQNAATPVVVRTRTTAVASSAPRPRPAMRLAPAAAPAILCGARTDDGTPCRHATTGGPCAAGHKPKVKPSSQYAHRSKTDRRPSETDEQFIHRGRAEAMAAGSQGRRPQTPTTDPAVGPRVAKGKDRVPLMVGRLGARDGEGPTTRTRKGNAIFNVSGNATVGQQVGSITGPVVVHVRPARTDENGKRTG